MLFGNYICKNLPDYINILYINNTLLSIHNFIYVNNFVYINNIFSVILVEFGSTGSRYLC